MSECRATAGQQGVRRRGAVWIALLAIVLLFSTACGKHAADTIVVGSKNFTEQIVLGELFAQQILSLIHI